MNKAEKKKIIDAGMLALDDVRLHPDDYEVMLGCYCRTNSLFSKVIIWWTRADPDTGSSHLSHVFIHKSTGLPVTEIHALEGFGVVPTVFADTAREESVIVVRRVQNAPTTEEVLKKWCPRLGSKYQKPFGFVTKSRRDDPDKWFCSEACDDTFDLQNRPSVFVSPIWGAASPKAKEKYGIYDKDGFHLNMLENPS